MSFSNLLSLQQPGFGDGDFKHTPSPPSTHLFETLKSIDEFSNSLTLRDVEMQAPLSEELTVVVLDTNILLEYLDVIQVFVTEVEERGLPVLIIIPGVVIYELDGQKNRERLSWFARRASSWLLKKVKERRSVKGQALNETCKASGNWKKRDLDAVLEFGSERSNDSLIIDCCKYFLRQRRTFLCSKDKLLIVEAESEFVLTISPSRNTFSSQDIAEALFGAEAAARFKFSKYHATYQNSLENLIQVTPAPEQDDDVMDVDDDASSVPQLLQPSHSLDLLHVQVIDYFTGLLLELVARVAGPDVRSFGCSNSASKHAPSYSRKNFATWGAVDCLDYLGAKKRLPRTSPRVDTFMTRPYEGVGARRGQDWSRRDWETALKGLREIGNDWQEGSIRESVPAAELHISRVFAMPMRPTGL
ncbi:PIN domain-containing protein [Suillus fuscotomentosus]|uniref:PIN domain-containing protein n=1 Tax=Suillus fuscotomentosus TaxID=1912939 RepID=A0AAD4EJ85_9AGAM|nr:PIN domain-containing protein [Suillus fuscotomentosus]KAG1907081.1 PIN domain-containing protein [Suillus fuscotomentosus]